MHRHREDEVPRVLRSAEGGVHHRERRAQPTAQEDPRLIEAFARFSQGHKDALLLLHCLPRDQAGWDLIQIINDWGIKGKVMFTDRAGKNIGDIHVSEEDMRRLYCSMDVHALSTGGEGFGIPLVEAMACGIPQVAPAYTSVPEFFGNNERGIAVPYDNCDTHHTGGFWCNVSVPKMAASFEQLYSGPRDQLDHSERGRAPSRSITTTSRWCRARGRSLSPTPR